MHMHFFRGDLLCSFVQGRGVQTEHGEAGERPVEDVQVCAREARDHRGEVRPPAARIREHPQLAVVDRRADRPSHRGVHRRRGPDQRRAQPLEGHLRAVQGDRGGAGGAQGRAGRDEGRRGRRHGTGGGVLQDPGRRDGEAQGGRRGRRDGGQDPRRRHGVADGRPAARRRRDRERGRQVAGEPDAAAGCAGEGGARAQRAPWLPDTGARREQGDDSEAREFRTAAAGGAAGTAGGDPERSRTSHPQLSLDTGSSGCSPHLVHR